MGNGLRRGLGAAAAGAEHNLPRPACFHVLLDNVRGVMDTVYCAQQLFSALANLLNATGQLTQQEQLRKLFGRVHWTNSREVPLRSWRPGVGSSWHLVRRLQPKGVWCSDEQTFLKFSHRCVFTVHVARSSASVSAKY